MAYTPQNFVDKVGPVIASAWLNAVDLLLGCFSGAQQAGAAGLAASTSYANDAAAAAGGVPVGGLYRNGSVVQVRVS